MFIVPKVLTCVFVEPGGVVIFSGIAHSAILKLGVRMRWWWRWATSIWCSLERFRSPHHIRFKQYFTSLQPDHVHFLAKNIAWNTRCESPQNSSSVVALVLFQPRHLIQFSIPQPAAPADMTKLQQQSIASLQQKRALQQMMGMTTEDGKSKHAIKDAVFVCVDCEAFEHVQSKITEIGVAVLDTRDIATLDNRADRDAWMSKMKYAHFRPVEYATLKNKTFVKGCPEQFNFGSTTWVNLKDVRHVLQRAFRNPKLEQAAMLSSALSEPGRNVVFVAHGASNDSAYMKQVGFSLNADADICYTLDTQVLAGGTKKNQVSLRRLLLSLGLEPVNLHNAGNDAAYTLQAMIAMALKDHEQPGSVAADLAKFAGKLPPVKYNPRVAPQVWAGTATRPDEVGDRGTKAVTVRGAPADKVQRRVRKHAARAVRYGYGTAQEAQVAQQALPALGKSSQPAASHG